MADQLTDAPIEVATVDGEALTADGSGAGATVEQANVTQADIEASNGVIHVVDTAILPGT
jgi:uncharacterized surface protein with fasciclin (FAS1) repeats